MMAKPARRADDAVRRTTNTGSDTAAVAEGDIARRAFELYCDCAAGHGPRI
jgi:hypothetical protein